MIIAVFIVRNKRRKKKKREEKRREENERVAAIIIVSSAAGVLVLYYHHPKPLRQPREHHPTSPSHTEPVILDDYGYLTSVAAFFQKRK